MNPLPICYPQPGKARSRLVLEAFAKGSGGRLATWPAQRLEPQPAAFYGLVGIEHLLREARRGKQDWFYGDNAFFDRCRGTFFRFARNEMQLSSQVKPDRARLAAIGVRPRPWRHVGKHIVVVEQSAHFLGLCSSTTWLTDVLARLRQHTDRPIRVRAWDRDKAKAAASLQADLEGCWALVTHMSAAATEALVTGVPVFVTGPCAASPMASGALADIESPKYPEGREEWAAGLAARQWTLEEIAAGMAWRALQEGA